MRHGLCLTGVMLMLAGTAQAAPGDKKDGGKNGKPTAATDLEYKQLSQVGSIVGKLTMVNPTDQMFTLEVEHQELQPKAPGKTNPGRPARVPSVRPSRNPMQQIQQLQRLILQLQRQQLQQLAKANNAYKLVTVNKDFDLQADENTKVRVMEAPMRYDDKGRLVKPDAKELKELKGPDPKLVGYTSSFDKLVVGQTVKVVLAQKKPPSKTKDKDKDKDNDKDKDKDKDKDADKLTDNKPVVKMIIIQTEEEKSDPAPKKKGDKKKN